MTRRTVYDYSHKFEIINMNFAHTIFINEFPEVYDNLVNYMDLFELTRTEMVTGGGNESQIPKKIKKYFIDSGWKDEHKFVMKKSIDGIVQESCSYKIDLLHEQARIAFDIEWNSKDSIFNRDLSNFRILHENNVIDLAVIFTRTHKGIMEVAKHLGIGKKYGASTTNTTKLIEKLELGILGKCPLLAIGIDKGCYNDHL